MYPYLSKYEWLAMADELLRHQAPDVVDLCVRFSWPSRAVCPTAGSGRCWRVASSTASWDAPIAISWWPALPGA